MTGGEPDGGATTTASQRDAVATVARVAQLRVAFSAASVKRPAAILSDRPLAIGRVGGAEPSLALADPRLSRLHAVVERAGDGWQIVDQESRNGTWVNGARVARETLRHGSVVRVGGTLLLFLDQEVPAREEPADRETHLVGPSLALQRVRSDLALVARRDTPVLILGETGVGKELVATEVHRRSGRTGSFVAVNCAAITSTLAESELFGHVPGSFTGATRRAAGLFVAANGGTLFLDEIGDLPLELQPKLLRALAQREVRPVGSVEPVAVDVRVVAATNRDLETDVKSGRFRADLYARISAWQVDVPPLRERREDILHIAQAFLGKVSAARRLSVDAAEALLLYGWPYNVRELEQVVATAGLRAASDAPRREQVVKLEHLPPRVAAALGARVQERLPSVESALAVEIDRDAAPSAEDLRRVLVAHDGNVSHVARFFGRTRKQIYRWAAAHGIDVAGLRGGGED
jgi:transcriptional regulator with GAF, ATPase, and Fis domain